MRSLKVWIIVCSSLLFGAGISLGWLLGVREVGVSSTASVATAPSEDFWRHWVATSEDFWDELDLDDSVKRELRVSVAPRVEAMVDLRTELEELAIDTRDQILEMMSESYRENAQDLLAAYNDSPRTGETLRELMRLDGLVGLEVHQEAGVYRILYDASRQRHEYFRDLGRLREEAEARKDAARDGKNDGRKGSDFDWYKQGRDRMKGIYALRDQRLEQVLTAEQYGKHIDWVESCHRKWRSRYKRKGRGDKTRRRPEMDKSVIDDESNEVPKT